MRFFFVSFIHMNNLYFYSDSCYSDPDTYYLPAKITNKVFIKFYKVL